MFLRSVLIAAAILLSACGSQPVKLSQTPEARQIALQQLDTFSVTGGLGVWTDEESISTRLDWQQNKQDFDVLVKLPAGVSSVRVRQKDSLASVQRGSADPVTGQSAAILLQQALGLGVALPIEQMSLWIRGLPGTSAEAVKYDDENRLSSMNYRDSQDTLWRVKVLQYKAFDGVYLPAIIVATGGPYNIRLVLKTWSRATSDEFRKAAPIVQPGTSSGRLKVPGR